MLQLGLCLLTASWVSARGSLLAPLFPAPREPVLALPPQQAEAAAPCLCFSRVHRHAEYRGAVHLHGGPTAAALRDLLHRGARGAHHDRLRLCKHRLPRGRFPEGKKLVSPAALPLPCSHLTCVMFATCGRGRRMRVCTSVSVCVCLCRTVFHKTAAPGMAIPPP